MRGIQIPANSVWPIVEVEVLSFGHIADFIGLKGTESWIERVQTPMLHALAQPDYDPMTRRGGNRYPSVNMYVDEEGLLKNQTINPRATLFYNPAGIVRPMFEVNGVAVGDALGGWIAGDALLLGEVKPGEVTEVAGLPTRVTVKYVLNVLDAIK